MRSCENNIHDAFVSNIVSFHSQQAVEKAFKALLEENDIRVPRVHNLIRLHECVEQFLILPIDLADLDALDSIYLNSRYPCDIGMIATGKPTLSESEELFESANRIYEIIFQSIK